MPSMFPMTAYLSPETMLPLTSLIATIAGFALLTKRSTIRSVVRCCRAALQKQPDRSPVKAPHFPRASRPSRQGSRR